jgi:hypothetical protein
MRGKLRTFRFGSQVGLSPLFSLSISSTLSDVPCIGNLKLDSKARAGISFSSSGLSKTGPSHSSVRILSSETLLVITFSSGGVVESGIVAGFVGAIPRPPPRSSWKIGIVERLQELRLWLYRHREEIGRFAPVSVGEEVRTWRLVVSKAGRDGGASLCCTICKTSQEDDDSTNAGFSLCKDEANLSGIQQNIGRENAGRNRALKRKSVSGKGGTRLERASEV